MGHDVLINATGLGSRYLQDVQDRNMLEVRSQTILAKSPCDKVYIRHGKDYLSGYTYVIPRLDGTVILGGIREYVVTSRPIDESTRHDLLRRVHANLPEVFPANPADFGIVSDLVGIQPQREAGVRVERETIGSQEVI
ncbi:hypothetical protein BDW59DRAFT_164790 [Aspergillus cavernicola]|uniref:FAD dependent oxidoreductase domain-containing protein n=1 Tax=Aspergillus cavernicola TaxID=176166 RepID=A0ABR4HXF0_9EURO